MFRIRSLSGHPFRSYPFAIAALSHNHRHPLSTSSGATCKNNVFNFSANASSNFKGSAPVGITGRSANGFRLMSSASSSFPEVVMKPEILNAREDEHDGVVVEMAQQHSVDTQAFTSLLRSSISYWQGLGKKGVWIKLPIELADLVNVAVKEGFLYHHAEPRYLMLVRWISETPNTLPINATHRVGVGAFVLNGKKEVLVVQEKNGILRGTGVWKFPTGVANEGEDICVAAVREVKEETGIDTKFEEVLSFRQSHKAFFQKSDLYFLCLLEPVSFDIEIQESELVGAQWMPFEEYASQPFVQKHELLRYTVKICEAKMEDKYSGFSPVSIKASFREGRDYLYMSHDDGGCTKRAESLCIFKD